MNSSNKKHNKRKYYDNKEFIIQVITEIPVSYLKIPIEKRYSNLSHDY